MVVEEDGFTAALRERGMPLEAGSCCAIGFDPTKQAWRMEIVDGNQLRVLWASSPMGPWGEVEGVDGSR